MKRYLFGGVLCVVAFGQLGCTSDTLDKEASNVIDQINAAANKIGSIAKAVESAVKTAEGKKENVKLDFTKAKEGLKSLEKTAESLLNIDNKLPRNLSEEKKEKLKKQLGSQVDAAMKRVEEKSEELRKALEKAEAIDPERTREFSQELTATTNRFTQIAARHN